MVPGLCLIIMLPVMLTVVGPVGIWFGFAVQWLYNALYLKDAFAIDLSRQEALYLTIYIHRVLEEHRTV